eukprot:TRINITY_DN7539_c0_g2_i1.p2 TRINITY_DN7539_c0_g2~~TRINITY_DN7539_c0_g2_i1.p2  ORF type:complete len:130 (-),score=5.47 TRINITY_DN7539_c0_g2_i1:61-423(-)
MQNFCILVLWVVSIYNAYRIGKLFSICTIFVYQQVMQFKMSNLNQHKGMQICNVQFGRQCKYVMCNLVDSVSFESRFQNYKKKKKKKNEQWPDFGCEGIKVQRAHQPTSQCQGKKNIILV